MKTLLGFAILGYLICTATSALAESNEWSCVQIGISDGGIDLVGGENFTGDYVDVHESNFGGGHTTRLEGEVYAAKIVDGRCEMTVRGKLPDGQASGQVLRFPINMSPK